MRQCENSSNSYSVGKENFTFLFVHSLYIPIFVVLSIRKELFFSWAGGMYYTEPTVPCWALCGSYGRTFSPRHNKANHKRPYKVLCLFFFHLLRVLYTTSSKHSEGM